MEPTLSPSRAADFLVCPLLYRFRTVDRLPEPPSAAAARGTLVHAVLERVFDLPADRRTPEEAARLVPVEWERMLAEEPGLRQVVVDDPAGVGSAGETGPGLTRWHASAVRLVERWFTLEDPRRLEPAGRELYVEADLADLTVRGYVDRVDRAPDGRLRVVDYKTGRAPSPTFEGAALFQLRFYALALWRSTGVLPARLQLVYLGDGVLLWTDPTEHEILATERKVRALWQAIDLADRTGDWRPRPSRACSWCAHRALCPAWGGTPPPVPSAQGSAVVASTQVALELPGDRVP
ncbi:RecB family exonuclease [Ornithinimicrobium sp. W1679]|uniref:RecB family exonuclease n=1 Tax=Ornithinimicrobium sp. W1679 TaxID=3418770 RepID=UPI003CE9C02C